VNGKALGLEVLVVGGARIEGQRLLRRDAELRIALAD